MALSDVTTGRLRLQRWDAAVHTPALEAINALPDALRYLNDGVPYTREETARQSERLTRHWAEYGFGLWAATIAATDRTIGFVGVAHPLWFTDLAHEVEIGWRLHPDAWGHGYATEAGRAALAAARDELGLTRIIAVIDPGNAPSLAVAARLGMTLERTVPHPQRPGDILIYVIEPKGARPL
jgi:RimJ/RimL family protein N-acetyltransferase